MNIQLLQMVLTGILVAILSATAVLTIFRKYMKKSANKLFAWTNLGLCVTSIVCASTLLWIIFAVPYFDNYTMEKQYGIKDIKIPKEVDETRVARMLEAVPTWLTQGTKGIVVSDQPLGWARAVVTEQGALCVIGQIEGEYNNGTDEVYLVIAKHYGDSTLEEKQDKEIALHEFIHRFWYLFLTNEDHNRFSELHSLECSEELKNSIFMAGNYTEGNSYYRDCIRMTTHQEEFVYKFTWFVMGTNQDKLSDKEVIYFAELSRRFNFTIPDTYKIREARAIVRQSDKLDAELQKAILLTIGGGIK